MTEDSQSIILTVHNTNQRNVETASNKNSLGACEYMNTQKFNFGHKTTTTTRKHVLEFG